MDVVSLSPLGVMGFVWQSPDGRCAQTVVVKATFALAPGQVTLAPEQDAPSDTDEHWNDDSTRSVISPSDKAPYKPRADVLLVGHAYAPNKQPVRSLPVRLIVGDLDKSLEVFCDRGFRIHDGQLLEGPRFTKSRLSWERAAGGPDTNNPIGMRFDAPPDAYGLIPLPNLQPPGTFVSKRSDTFAPIGFGPIAPSWSGRTQRLGRLAGSFPQPGWSDRPLPEGLDFAFFQAAPPDQQVAEIRRNERIVLENLHPDHPRLITSLPNFKPRAMVERATGEREEVSLVADTLLIDTDRAVCVVTWRGRIGLRHAQEPGRITVTLEIEEKNESYAASGSSESGQTKKPATLPPAADDEDPDNGTTTLVPPNERPSSAKTFVPSATGSHGKVMPFVGSDQSGSRPSAPPPRPTNAALPFQPAAPNAEPSTIGTGPSWFKDRVQPAPVAPTSNAPWPFGPKPAAPAPVATPAPPPPITPPGTVVPPSPVAPPISVVSAPPMVPPAPVAIPPARSSAPDLANSPWASGPPPTGAMSSGFGPTPSGGGTTGGGLGTSSSGLGTSSSGGLGTAAAVGLGTAAVVGIAAAASISSSTPASAGRPGSAQAASDAAADAQARAAAAAATQPASKPVSTSTKPQRAPTGDVLDLLWYEESFVPRIRHHWEELVTELDFEPADPRRDLSAEDPEKARVRHNVFGILSDGEMVEPSGLSRVITEAVNQRGRFTPPLALTGGELRFPFDEVETLKATIVAMTPFLGSDKKLKETVDGMNELVKTPYLQGSTGIVDKLLRDLRAQFRDSNRSLPSNYLDGHVERLLLEQRRYAIRKVFGGEFIRALLTLNNADGSKGSPDSAIPVYMPKHLDQTLPMLVVMKVRIIVECHLQQDPYDTNPYALRTIALGRSYQLDALRSGSKASA